MTSGPRRTLALLDVENLLYGSPLHATTADYAHAISSVAARAELRIDDHPVIAADRKRPEAAYSCGIAWPGAAIRVGEGTDGADRVLSGQLHDVAMIQRTYHTVVIGSGDHHFVPSVIELNRLGVRTMVVSWGYKLSRELRLAAFDVRLLDGSSAAEVGLAA